MVRRDGYNLHKLEQRDDGDDGDGGDGWDDGDDDDWITVKMEMMVVMVVFETSTIELVTTALKLNPVLETVKS